MSNLGPETDPSREIAQWLQEVARRRYPGAVPPRRRTHAPEPLPQSPKRSLLRQTISLAALAAAYLQYHMLDVMLQIASMPSVTVFV